ncbi:MAG TPA: transglutaminase-like domain-containing protein [Pseudolysinimonas sp.]|jgi:transglutaminase-like putative cysteine protease
MTLQVDASTAFVLAVSPAREVPLAWEALTVSLDGRAVEVSELDEDPLTRLRLFSTTSGLLMIDYSAEIVGRAPEAAVSPTDPIVYLRPSRYVQSDTLTPFARDTFPGLNGPHHDGARLVREVSAWVHDRLEYVPNATSPTGGAVETLESGQGVCRDYAHLTAALLRALDVPARLVSVYAPQLRPMDFHAVVEAMVDERWVVVDSTRLAPRRGMVRMATGRDATDTAFLTNTLSDIQLLRLAVDASSSETLDDDPDELVALS